MDDFKAQVIEIYEETVPYSERVLAAIDDAVEELNGVKMPETDSLVNSIIEGINYLFEVYNGTKSVVNPTGKELDESIASSGVTDLQRAMRFSNDSAKADALYKIGTFIKCFHDEAAKYMAN